MTSVKDQFQSKIQTNHFEADTHIDTDNLLVNRIHVLSGITPAEDIVIVTYKSSPNLSFYNAQGKLLDIDHYLPDAYKEKDALGVDVIIANLSNINSRTLKSRRSYAKLMRETYEMGGDNLAMGLMNKFGLNTSTEIVEKFKEIYGFKGDDLEFRDKLENLFPTFYDFLVAYILNQQGKQNSYVHITNRDNIIITTLDKRSGYAVMIETQDFDGQLLPPSKWNIIRSQDSKELERLLVFRAPDIKMFFENDGYENSFKTDRYVLYDMLDRIEIDSLLDNTDNRLVLDVVGSCIQTLVSDENIIAVLTTENEVAVVNTNRSVVPQKWPKKIALPVTEQLVWMQVDENLSLLFAQNSNLEIIVYDISGNFAEEVTRLGIYAEGFRLTQSGDLILHNLDRSGLVYMNTNCNEIVPKENNKNLSKIFSDLSHLFKGDAVFTKTRYAVDITEVEPPKEEAIPSVVEVAKYDFESNIEAMLAKAESDYEALLDVKNKISIARQNINEELSRKASEEGINFVGQRLKRTINSIVKPSEIKVKAMLESLRAEEIIGEMRNIDERIEQLEDPSDYKDILNVVRAFEEEVQLMSVDTKSEIYAEFKSIQKELNTLFSEQISEDGYALFSFMNGEIEQVEKAIKETYDMRQLEVLMSTHPAALELMDIIKQPFVLQSFAKSNDLSPAGIQKRLFNAIETRRLELEEDAARKKAEIHAAKLQLVDMIKESIHQFVNHHSGGFSDLELEANAAYNQIQKDISKLERSFSDLRIATEMRRRLKQMILDKNRADLERLVTIEGKYAYVQNDPDLYVDMDHANLEFPTWSLELIEKKAGTYLATFIRDADLEVYRPSTTDNLRSGRSFEISEDEYETFFQAFDRYADYSFEFVDALWTIAMNQKQVQEYPQFQAKELTKSQPNSVVERKALRCCLEMERRNHEERNRERNVPVIGLEFIDETPFFQTKLKEFLIKAKLQMMSGSGVLLLTGPPSTGKSAFLKFASALMNREYFEHASDKWQTKNSLVTAIKFGENGPYSVPAGFTKAITTPYSLVNIEEIKEWPEALRKSLNPFFAGSKRFIAPDGTAYKIGTNILLCAATNLGAVYRQDDEPFTSDFWSRIEVVEYDYAAEEVSRDYLFALQNPRKNHLVTMKDVVREYFKVPNAPREAEEKAGFLAQQLVEFSLLPKADEEVKRENLQNYIHEYFNEAIGAPSKNYNPEEAVKVVLKRLPDLQGYSALEFFDLYNHFVNGESLKIYKLSKLQTSDVKRYTQLKILILCIRFIEGCLRKLRDVFHSSAGQTEIEGTNREFIKCVYLLGLLGDLN